MGKLITKGQALAYMAIGLRVRHILWDTPYHFGCIYAFLKDGEIWCKDTKGNITYWLTINRFKIECRETGWYIYEV